MSETATATISTPDPSPAAMAVYRATAQRRAAEAARASLSTRTRAGSSAAGGDVTEGTVRRDTGRRVGSDSMNGIYRTIAGRIRAESQDLARVVERTDRIWQQALTSGDDYYVDATALNLHGFYAGLERLLEIIADGVDQAKPGGAHWHDELLRQMAAEIPGVRPPVLSQETRERLDRYRGFRRVVRNAYNLDPEQIGVLVKQLAPTMARVAQELTAFADFLEQVA